MENPLEQPEGGSAANLISELYEELHKLAEAKLARERPGQTLQATALLHEAYLRVAGGAHTAQDPGRWNSRPHFFAAAAEAMRRILIDNARRKKTGKHGGDLRRTLLEDHHVQGGAPEEQLLTLNEALDRFEKLKPEAALLVKLRYFAGFTIDEAAQSLEISKATANRQWAFAKAWLQEELREE